MSDLKILTFTGVVDHAYTNPDVVKVGGVSVLTAIHEVIGYDKRQAIVHIKEYGGELQGELEVALGSDGWSSWTPGENAMLWLGEEDILEKLIALEGESITLTVGFP